VLHRVVWDEFLSHRHGIHLWSANADGSHAHRIYTSHRGFTTELTLDRSGRRVAFAPCCRDDRPELVVVPVGGGHVLEPLAHHPQFYFVGGIGWSPHGSRLVFEGEINRHQHLTQALWTVRPDGSGLHRMLRLPDPRIDDSGPNEALAWTRDGVLYCQAGSLRIAHHGRSRVLIRGDVFSVRISGDGRHIVTERDNPLTVRSSIWYGDADGTHQRRLWLGPRTTTSHAPLFGEPIPDFHGRHLLTTRQSSSSDGVVGWRVGADPDRAPVLDFLSNAFGYAWN
jgi:dipeptidyl aminopeptidase/acylaminoacyl peptidase